MHKTDTILLKSIIGVREQIIETLFLSQCTIYRIMADLFSWKNADQRAVDFSLTINSH